MTVGRTDEQLNKDTEQKYSLLFSEHREGKGHEKLHIILCGCKRKTVNTEIRPPYP
jgi:hypothetical protein